MNTSPLAVLDTGTAVTVVGTLRLTPKKFGFVSDFTSPVDGLDDLFVPPPVAAGVVDGDIVEARGRVGRDGRAAAETISVLERRRRLLPVVLEQRDGRWSATPAPGFATDTIRLARSVRLPRSADRRGAVIELDALDGNGCCTALLTVPVRTDGPQWAQQCAIAWNLDGTGDVELDGWVKDLLTGQTAPARAVSGAIPGARLTRTDRRSQTTFTIDGASSRDLDDAISAHVDGSVIAVDVHIADVASVVGVGSAADGWARKVGASLYLADRCVPMLHPSLSEDLLSLLPGQDRPALTISFAVHDDGTVESRGLEISTICSDARLTYHDVEAHLAGGTGTGAVWSALDAAGDAARRLRTARDRRDVLPSLWDPADVDIAVVDGRAGTVPAGGDEAARDLIETLMVAANETVAAFLADTGAAGIFRSHVGVDDAGARSLGALAAGLGLDAAFSVPVAAGDLLGPLGELGDGAAAERFRREIGFAMSRATYGPDPAGHFGLGSDRYCHATSPIRRYADLVVHRAVRAKLAGEADPYTTEELHALGAELDARTVAHDRTESHETKALWSSLLLHEHRRGERSARTGTVVGLKGNGLRVRLDALPVAGTVNARSIRGWSVDDHGLEGAWSGGQVRLGDPIDVQLGDVDVATGTVEWVVPGVTRRGRRR